MRRAEPLHREAAGRWLAALAGATVFALGVLVYANALNGGFVWDDPEQILENRWLRDFGNIPEIALSDVWGHRVDQTSDYYRPTINLAYLVVYQVFGASPVAFHLLNVMLHAFNSLLVFIVFRRALPSGRGGQFPAAAWGGAALFAVHPIHTEAVAWMAGFSDLALTSFALLSFFFFLTEKRRILSAIFLFLAAVSKEPAVVLPVVFLIYELTLERTRRDIPNLLVRYAPYIVSLAAYFLLRHEALGVWIAHDRGDRLPGRFYLLNCGQLLLGYAEKLLIPLGLNAYHSFHPIASFWSFRWIATAGPTLALLAGAGYCALKRHRLTPWIAWLLLPLLPALHVPSIGDNVLAERYLYLPSVGFCALLAVGMEAANRNSGRLRWMLNLAVMAIVLLCSVATLQRNEVWTSEVTLWEDVVEKSPDAYEPRVNLGAAYVADGRNREALIHYREAVKIDPERAGAHINLGVIYHEQGDYERAVAEYRRSLVTKPDSLEARYNLGLALTSLKDFDSAMAQFERVIARDPNHARAHKALGDTYYRKGRFDLAQASYRRAIDLDPGYENAKSNLALAIEAGSMSSAGDEAR